MLRNRKARQPCVWINSASVPLNHLDSLGLLGPQTVLFHCVNVTDKEIDRLAESGTSVVHCPESNMKLGNGCAPVQKLLDAGVCVALGTDGPASNNDLNMFREMASAALLQKGFTGNPRPCRPRKCWTWQLFLEPRRWGLKKIGCIAPGYKADIIALDAEAPHLMPMYSPVSPYRLRRQWHGDLLVHGGRRHNLRPWRLSHL